MLKSSIYSLCSSHDSHADGMKTERFDDDLFIAFGWLDLISFGFQWNFLIKIQKSIFWDCDAQILCQVSNNILHEHWTWALSMSNECVDKIFVIRYG